MSAWQSARLNRIPWLTHGTSTRVFGSLRYPNAGETDMTLENRARFLRSLGMDPARLSVCGNAHGNLVAGVSEPGYVPERDGIFTSETNVVLGTKTADCLPLFFADLGRRTVAVVHAGWKGLAAGVVVNAVRALRDVGCDPADVVVAIGPGIGPCHYEIGSPRRDDMLARTPYVLPGDFTSVGFPYRGGGRPGDDEEKFMADLRAIAVRQLVASGAPRENIDASAPCTACEPDRFFSYHASRNAAEQMLSVISVRAVV
jgi:YfiH family protein